ncbi:prepilin-type N-terminal cleavage/methylation domain-containing protein [Candidatus Parcubacteria bacterium]|nr:prepilin-type N-terminal cleavage/methylation domain-containing protein [Candidatus Parcubacteria bacterium]
MKSKGFTLIELLVVVAIIGILATVVLASLGSARSRARDAKRITELKQIQNALELYYLDNNSYPVANAVADCNANTTLAPLVSGGYVPSLPTENTLPFCINYYSQGGSAWTCNGENRGLFSYAFFFALENPNTSLTQTISNSSGFTHCIVGPRL